MSICSEPRFIAVVSGLTVLFLTYLSAQRDRLVDQHTHAKRTVPISPRKNLSLTFLPEAPLPIHPLQAACLCVSLSVQLPVFHKSLFPGSFTTVFFFFFSTSLLLTPFLLISNTVLNLCIYLIASE